MTLQILINHFKEPFSILKRLLDSIQSQIGIDADGFEVLICSDGNDSAFWQTDFAIYTMPLKYYAISHRGVCATRNFLMDHATADYLMFCDCDDTFSRTDGLCTLLSSAEKTNADIIGSDYNGEDKTEKGFTYKLYSRDTLRLHGKIFRRRYLIENNIRYPDEMTFSGDMYFLYLAYNLTDKIVWLPDNFYIWKWMPESVTRGKSYYGVRTYRQCRKCYILVLEELKRRNMCEEYAKLLMILVIRSYFDWYSAYFADAPEELAKDAKNAVQEFIHQYGKDYLILPEKDRHKRYIQFQISHRTYGPPTKYAGLDDWMSLLLP